MNFRLWVLGLALLPILFSTRTSRAQAPGAESPSVEDGKLDQRGLTGFEAMLRPGFGSAGSKSPVAYEQAPLVLHPDPGQIYDGSSAPYGAGLSGELSLGYRFIPNLSAGVYGEMRSSSTSSVNDGTESLSRSGWGTGVYVRAYLPSLHAKLDPYVQVGVGYMKDKQQYQRGIMTTLGSMPGDWSLEHHGVAVPLAIGIDYRLLPILAVGPSFRYAQVFGVGACLRESVDTQFGAVSSKQCTDADTNQRITKAESYAVWSAGLDMRLTL